MFSKYEIDTGNGNIVFEIGKIARQTNGSVLARFGGTAVICVAVMGNDDFDGDFFPLTTNYFEKAYAAGKIPGGFMKREGKPSDHEILVSRLIDRPIRPLFPKDFKREVQVIAYTVSTDQINTPDILAINAASCALSISDIPFQKPIGASRVAYKDGKFILNPSFNDKDTSQLDIVIAGTYDAILMVEGGAHEVSEEILLEACKIGHEGIKKIVNGINAIVKEIGKTKISVKEAANDKELTDVIISHANEELKNALFIKEKQDRSNAIDAVKKKYLTLLKSTYAQQKKTDISKVDVESNDEEQEDYIDTFDAMYSDYFDNITQDIMRKSILNENKRPDGRKCDEIRPITIEINLFEYTHGSALFTRGETQALVVTTLGSANDQQLIDGLQSEESKAFMLHYNFPPFSVNETGRYGPPGRREIGHGHLAERSIIPLLPNYDAFPYTIRTVSEILESNGSSSMATVCGTSLSLYAAGAPIPRQVAGIAMGLILEGEKYAILSDIMGLEDHLGDMDFKVAGTEKGITGFQMDIKIEGITFDIFKKALEQANKGRMHILSIMNEECKKYPCKLSDKAPRIHILRVDTDKIGLLIGPGGKTIKAIISETGSEISIENDGTVVIANKDAAKLEHTINVIYSTIETDPVLDTVYNGTVKKILPYGLLVEFMPKNTGLLHVSELSNQKINNLEDIYRLGDKIKVRLLKIDQNGKFVLSHKEFTNNESSN